MQPGYYRNIPNDQYHAGPGVSKSLLDYVRHAPALVQWVRNAPRDDQAETAVDVGDAFHALLTEPDRFKREYLVAPEFNRRSNAGKAAYESFLYDARGKTVLTAEEYRKLRLMRESTYAHPWARMFLEEPADTEACIYWTDPETGLLCRCRMDRRLTKRPIILDVKTTADMDRFAASIEEYRYHVQDAFYSEGYLRHFGERPAFIFLVVSTTRSAGRYPVRMFSLKEEDKAEGREEFRADLGTYAECERRGTWPGIESITRPPWKKSRATA